jgi:hypothetical protein
MTHRIRLPEAYVLASSDVPDAEWLGNLLRVCISTVTDTSSIEVIDELYASADGDVISAAVKLAAPMSDEQFRRLSNDLRSLPLQKLNVRMVRVNPNDAKLPDQAELHIEYFRREFARDSQMVRHTDSCVRVTHVPTGTVARSTLHRNRVLNQDEALLLLKAALATGPNDS